MRRCFFLLIVCWLPLWQPAVRANLIGSCTLERLVAESDVLVVEEVVKTETLGSIPNPITPLLRCKATLRVLRSLATKGAVQLVDGQTIEIEYTMPDWGRMSGPHTSRFDHIFRTGRVEVLPLKAPAAGAATWQLAVHESWCIGSTLPATALPLADVHPTDPYEFIAAELAGALLNGTRYERAALASYLWDASLGPNGGSAAPLDAIDRLLVAHVDDEACWFDIFLALYATGGWVSPHPKIAELRATPTKHKRHWFLAARALSRIDPQDLDGHLIAALIAQGEHSPFSTAAALELNYAHDARVARQLQAALEQAEPGALSVTYNLLSKRGDLPEMLRVLGDVPAKDASPKPYRTLLPAALSAARRELAPAPANPQALKSACALLVEYGTKSDVAALLKEIERARTADRVRYQKLVLSSLGGKAATLPIWRVVLGDATVVEAKYWGTENWRYCDFAAREIQGLARVDFGLKEPPAQMTLAVRDQAVAKAKAWLAKHPQG